MGNVLFLLLHIIAVLFAPIALVLTIPLHLIYAAVRGRSSDAPAPPPAAIDAPTPDTHVRCPDCAELVRREARVCKHCGRSLTPAPAR